MLARIAHELFWLGRYVARAEHTARMLDGVFQTDLAGSAEDPRGVELTWPGLLAVLGASTDGGYVGRDEALRRLTLDEDEGASLISCVAHAREGARTVRDVISADMWEVINTTHLVLQRNELSGHLLSSPYSVYRYVKERSALFWGLTGRTMLRDEANSFLSAGGRIESADMSCGCCASPSRWRARRTSRGPGRPRRCSPRSAVCRPSAGRCRHRRTPSRWRASCSTS